MQAILDFFVIIIFFFFFSSSSLWPLSEQLPNKIRGNESDYEALLAIKAQISDDPYSVLSSWNTSLHFCQWEGITCGHRHKRVVIFRIVSSKLGGTLSPFIGNLSFLRALNLYHNSFRGDIPRQISHLPRLRSLALGLNSFGGEIPSNLSRCSQLSQLGLDQNQLVGKIPSELSSLPLIILLLNKNNLSGRLQDIGIGNMSSSLQVLYLSDNQLQGSIPDDIGRLQGVAHLQLGENDLSGTIPTSLFNLSLLQTLDLCNSTFHGHLPQDLGLRVPQLSFICISKTFLTGPIPASLSNLSNLQGLEIPFNSFTGRFSLNGNNLPRLSWLNINYAFSAGGEARDMSFIDTLTNCTSLMHLWIAGNSFTGTFPKSILNISSTLQMLDIKVNHISGQLPLGLGKFVNLSTFNLVENLFTGPIPTDIGEMESIENIFLLSNNFSGEIPSSLGNLTHLSQLDLAYNSLEGLIPASLGNCKNLLDMSLASNRLSGVLPAELFHASELIDIEIGQNNFQGPLPGEIGNLKNLFQLDVSRNKFSGEIPTALGGCTSLSILNMSHNSFSGSIPESLSPLKSIQELDLSHNNLSGQIPTYLSAWPYLSSLNLSFNALEGEVPVNGVFANTSVVSVVGNTKLCGGVPGLHLPRCPSHRETKKRRLSLAMIVIISIVCVLIIILAVALSFYFLCSSRKRKDDSSGLQDIKPLFEVSYQMLSRATNGFSPSNLLGIGGFGSVYKGDLHKDDTELVVAVKVMNLQNDRASRSFIAECNALRNIRHRNLVKIITVCSSIDNQRNDFKALVYEFMTRGSLENWLYSSKLVTNEDVDGIQICSLSLFQRLSITIDVASALEYLHTGCATPIIHCDLKPSNILLDDEMTAHVGDFGLAKFLSGASTSSVTNHSSSTQVRGTVGYAAPEYGLGSKVSREGDMYSFGIIVLEMMTSKKPTDPMFNDGLNLHDFAKSSLPNRAMEIIDQTMLDNAILLPAKTGADVKKMECIKSLIMIGVQCSVELPQERMTIEDAISKLKSEKNSIQELRN